MRGILNINKPKGITSFDVVAKLRKILNIKKIGHAGTLDPLATGVLPIFISNATRLIQFVPKIKSYRAYARLGIETETYDTEGEIISKKISNYNLEEIKNILRNFEGKYLQTPPIYSAISVNGKRLYEYARKNQEVEIPQKEVEIFKIEVVDFLAEGDFPLLIFDINCASGVYVRSVIHDLGQKLKTGAMMENLIRTMSANLKIENSVNLDELRLENVSDYLIDPRQILDLEEILLNDINFDKIKKGQFISNISKNNSNNFVELVYNDNLVGVGLIENDLIKPKVILM